ncbi:hypothetical protein [Dactylosporangium sp. CS-033363]|uniref:hypothetical protein n=1 Tax=Dactylosporangium sp. CS-033363 TaxID=3239935 RepID=UPI003D8ECAA9
MTNGFVVTALVVLAVWLLVLSVLFASVVRHLGSMQATMLGIAAGNPFDFASDGPELMRPLPEGVRELFAREGVGPAADHVVLFVSGACEPCQERVEAFSQSPAAAGARLIVLAAGRDTEKVEQMRAVLAPSTVAFFTDPDAHEAVQALNIKSTPFAFRLREGKVVEKAYVSSAAALEDLLRPVAMAAPAQS